MPLLLRDYPSAMAMGAKDADAPVARKKRRDDVMETHKLTV